MKFMTNRRVLKNKSNKCDRCWKSVFCLGAILKILIVVIASSLFTWNVSFADEDAGENASNPLAAVSNTDFRVKYFDLDDSDRQEAYIDGATMINPKLKLKYEAHWWSTDVTGKDENDWESVSAKLIYFPREGLLKSGRPYRLAVGLEWIVDLGDQEKGIGSGADQIGPFVGLAIAYKPDTTLSPLLQHYESYSGADVSLTASRLIAIQSLSNDQWLQKALKVPYNWENESWPASLEIQYGKSFTPKLGAYIDLQSGIGGDRDYDYAVGLGLRFNY